MSVVRSIVFFLCGLAAATAFAQGPGASERRSITIADAIDEALERNLSLLAERSCMAE